MRIFNNFTALIELIIVLSVVTAQIEENAESGQQTNIITTVQSTNIINCRSDNFQSKLFLIKLTQRDSWILLIGSSIALIIQMSFVLLTFKIPRLRQQPGDILLGAFCAESILSIHWFQLIGIISSSYIFYNIFSSLRLDIEDKTQSFIDLLTFNCQYTYRFMMSLEAILYPDAFIYQDDAFCILNSIFSIVGSALQGLYNFFFFLFIGFSIKNSLRVTSISRKKTHVFTVGVALIFLGIILLMNMNGKTLYGTCSYVSDESFPMASILLYLVFLFFAIIILLYFNQKIPDTTFYKKKRQEFLSFSRLYLSFCLLMWGIIAICNTALFLNCQYVHSESLLLFSTIGNSAKVICSIILPIIRIKDPYLRSIIRQEKKNLKINSSSRAKISRLSQKYKDQRRQLSSFDELKLTTTTSVLVPNHKGELNNQLSQQEIEAKLSIFDNTPSSNMSEKGLMGNTQKERKSNIPSYLPPIFSLPSSISTNQRKQSKPQIKNKYVNYVFLSKKHEFIKTLNQEITKKRMHTRFYEYIKKNSLSSEMQCSQSQSQSLDIQNPNSTYEDTSIKEKLNEILMNVNKMDYFSDPFYRDGSQSESGSFTDIDAIFGHESLSSGSSSLHQNSQLQAETIDGSKEHFIRILQRNIKMGVLCRILCGIQIHFIRKKRYCTKVDIFQDTYTSVFNCKISSNKLNKNSFPLSSQKSSLRFSICLRQVSLQLQDKSPIVNTKNKTQDENEIFYEIKIYQFSDESIKSNLHHAPTQLMDSDTFDLVRMRVYAPIIFHSLQQSEVEISQNQDDQDPYKPKNVIDIEKAFNIQDNMTQIKNASGSDGGKSGQFFFFSHDNKFLLKTINERELKILLERLPSYFRYLKSNPNSLIAKIFGMYTFEGLNESLIHLILMKNIAACPKQFIERTYDLKGSRFDREVLPKTKKESESFSRSLNKMILKDIDFINLEKKIYIRLEDRHRIYAQLKKDANFLCSCGWIDYSLIVFKINRKRHTEWKESNYITYLEEEEDLENQLSDYCQFESSEQRGIYYHIGIIDYLQLYDMQKRFEKWAKRIIHLNPKLDTSSQDPETYSKRFINYMKQILEI